MRNRDTPQRGVFRFFLFIGGLGCEVANSQSGGIKGTFGLRKEAIVYLSKSAFSSRPQLYMTMHHGYMHAYFFKNGFNYSSKLQHKIINQWHYDQAVNWGGPLPKFNINYHNTFKAFRVPFPIHYSRYNFNIINNIP
ncbi:hypothetical protein [Sinomicrobium oceani]|uniref:hypothetical protein n=1 Tax=Sinomicrobium oceani TaxID=1150368 RepID=UPI00227C27D8|nr:hypothetical protein [Sinomicrobium oceani]